MVLREDYMEHDLVEFEPRLKQDLHPEEMLRIIFDFAAKIANERNLDNVLMLMVDMTDVPFGCSTRIQTSSGPRWPTA
jgi:hypothetical protein